jgi:hypothetical protein
VSACSKGQCTCVLTWSLHAGRAAVLQVFGIVSVQLLVTVGIACIFLFNNTLKVGCNRRHPCRLMVWHPASQCELEGMSVQM